MDVPIFYAGLAVFGGGMLGGAVRYVVMARLSRKGGRMSGPIVTHTVNLTGSMAMGVLAGATSITENPLGLIFGVGFLGSYTTVSTFSLDIVQLAHTAPLRRTLAHAALPVVGCPILAWAGYGLMHMALS